MIKLKLDKLSEKFRCFSMIAKIEFLVFRIEKQAVLISIMLPGSIYIRDYRYKKTEFWKAIKDFLILNKMMKKNNGK